MPDSRRIYVIHRIARGEKNLLQHGDGGRSRLWRYVGDVCGCGGVVGTAQQADDEEEIETGEDGKSHKAIVSVWLAAISYADPSPALIILALDGTGSIALVQFEGLVEQVEQLDKDGDAGGNVVGTGEVETYALLHEDVGVAVGRNPVVAVFFEKPARVVEAELARKLTALVADGNVEDMFGLAGKDRRASIEKRGLRLRKGVVAIQAQAAQHAGQRAQLALRRQFDAPDVAGFPVACLR